MPKPPRAATSGNVFIVVAPSGAGKSSLIAKTLEGDDNIVLSISCTTRPRRPGEVNNRDYRFVTEAEFLELRDTNQLLEWARVHSNYYGTRSEERRVGNEGRYRSATKQRKEQTETRRT